MFKGRSVTEFFNIKGNLYQFFKYFFYRNLDYSIGLTASAVGNHEFDLGLDAINKNFGDSKFKYLNANIFDKNTKKRAKMPNTKGS